MEAMHRQKRSKREAAAIEKLRGLCLAFPGANERLSHGEPTWFAGKGKSFAMLDNHHHGAAHLSVWLPQPVGVQQSLIAMDAQRFFRPPYVGVNGWVGIVLDHRPDWKGIEGLLRDAFLHVAGTKLRATLRSSEGADDSLAHRVRKKKPGERASSP